MKFSFYLLIAVLVCGAGSFGVHADGRPDHFKGKPATTLEEAVNNFSEYNDELAVIVSKEELSPQDSHEVHQLTYTLENALEKIRWELAELAETLEAVHVASEHADVDKIKAEGKAYLEKARQVVE